jgi:hypothetical protein
MTLLTDIASALDTYPIDEVTVSIVDVALQSGTQSVINVNETWKFKAKVENNGHVNMTEVSLHVFGLNGALVSLSPTTGFTAGVLNVGSLTINGGGGSQKTEYLYFKAPSATKPAGTVLVEAHIGDWNCNFDHYFTNHTKDDLHAPQGTYAAQVFP